MRQLKITKSITNRSSEALDKYLVEIGRVPMITVDEEIELAQAIRNGGKAGERAKEKLVKANFRGFGCQAIPTPRFGSYRLNR